MPIDNQPSNNSYVTKASPPSTNIEDLNELYPPFLDLKHLTILHRHGDRTPLSQRFESIFPNNWNFCKGSNQHEASILNFKDPFNTLLTPQTNLARNSASSGNMKFKKLYEDQFTIGMEHQKLISNCFYGQLTDEGRATLHKNGEALRKIYVDHIKFLPKFFNHFNKPDSVYLRSTKYERTIESLHQLLNGLYPAEYISDRTDNSKSEILIRIREHTVESLYPDYSCKNLSTLFNQFKDINKKLLSDRWLALRKVLTEKTNFKQELEKSNSNQHDMFMNIHQLFDTIYSAKAHNILNIKGLDDDSIAELDDLHTQLWFGGMQKSQKLLQLSVGRLFGELRNKIENVRTNQTNEKISVYSGHDTTIAPLLIGLSAFDGKWPQYGSMIMLELFEDKTNKDTEANKYMRIKYNNKILELPQCKKEGNHHQKMGPSMCNLSTIIKIFKNNEIQDYELHCNSNEKTELAASLLSGSK